MPEDLRDSIQRAADLGRQLYALDTVAAIGTDVMLANVKDPVALGLVGYLPIRDGDDDGAPIDSFSVIFFTGDDPPRIALEVGVAPGRTPELRSFDPPKDMSEGVAMLARARRLALEALPERAQPLNPLVVPAEGIGETGILVYLLAGTQQPNVVVLGKHYRVRLSEDAASVQAMEPLSKSVIELPTVSPEGTAVESLFVTHIVSDFPLETHVLASLQAKLPIYVATKRGLWRVAGAEISLVKGPE